MASTATPSSTALAPGSARSARPAGPRRPRRGCWPLLALALAAHGCAGGPGRSGDFKLVQFEAPAYPDAELQPILDSVEAIGVLSTTNIEPVQGLDIEKVMGRLTDATVSGLRRAPDRRVITQDEIRWHFKGVEFDSAAVHSPETRADLQREMEIDALVFLTLQGFEAQRTPVTPTQYGLAPTPGMNISVDLELSLINLETGKSWSHLGRQRDWQPMQVQVLGGSDRTEQQLLTALGQPLRQFLARVSPPPSLEGRHFDLSGD